MATKRKAIKPKPGSNRKASTKRRSIVAKEKDKEYEGVPADFTVDQIGCYTDEGDGVEYRVKIEEIYRNGDLCLQAIEKDGTPRQIRWTGIAPSLFKPEPEK